MARWGWLCLLTGGACAPEEAPPTARPADDVRAGPVVIAGGGAEGDDGDASAWSARLYPHLWDAGDVTGDGRVTVVVLSTVEESPWLPAYLVALGADEAVNLEVGGRARAGAADVVAAIDAADAVFIKGGDQGLYYDLWNDTPLEEALQRLHGERGGGVGGTSAGAMSMAGFALAGGQDLVSQDVLADARSPWLDDVDGGSGVHEDFFGFWGGAVVDTHFTARARLGRLAGVLALVVDAHEAPAAVGIGVEERTGAWRWGERACVIGDGAVAVLRGGTEPPRRVAGEPLVWTELRLDRLTDGWCFDAATGDVDVDAPPPGASAVTAAAAPPAGEGVWYVDGDLPRHEERFAWVVERAPRPFQVRAGVDAPVLDGAIGVLDAFDGERRAAAEEALFRGLHDRVGATGFVLGAGASAARDEASPARVRVVDNPEDAGPPLAALVIDTAGVTWRSLAPVPSAWDAGDGALAAAGLVGARLHVVYTPSSGLVWDHATRRVVAER